MSRHLLIRCDAPGCAAQTETHASDTEPTRVDVPSGWLTLIEASRQHKHYCSEACVARAYASALPSVIKITVPESPAPVVVATKRKGGGPRHDV